MIYNEIRSMDDANRLSAFLKPYTQLFLYAQYGREEREGPYKYIRFFHISDGHSWDFKIYPISVESDVLVLILKSIFTIENVVCFDLMTFAKLLPALKGVDLYCGNIIDLKITLNNLVTYERKDRYRDSPFVGYDAVIAKRIAEKPLLDMEIDDEDKKSIVRMLLLDSIYRHTLNLVKEQDIVDVHALEQKVNVVVSSNLQRGFFIRQEKIDALVDSLQQERGRLRKDLSKSLSSLPKRIILPRWDVQQADLNNYLKMLRYTRETLSIEEIYEQFSHVDVVQIFKELSKVQFDLWDMKVNLKKAIQPGSGRITSEVFQNGTATGRITVKNYNYQSVHKRKEFRQCFSTVDGMKLVIADYCQSELVIAADLSGDPVLIDAINTGQDLHSLTASKVLAIPPEEITPEARKLGKGLNFGILYGMGPRSLSSILNEKFNLSVSELDSQDYIDSFFRGYSTLKRWRDSIPTSGCYISKTRIGRRRYFSKEPATKRWNTPIQSTGADLFKTAIVMLGQPLRGISGSLVGYIHDELIIEVPEENAQMGKVLLEKSMIDAGNSILQNVKVTVESSIRDSWWS